MAQHIKYDDSWKEQLREEMAQRQIKLRREVADKLSDYLESNHVTSRKFAESNFSKLGYGSPITANEMLCSFGKGKRLGSTSYAHIGRRFTKRELELTSILFGIMRIQNNDPLVQEIRDEYRQFDYRGQLSEKEMSVINETSDLVQRLRKYETSLQKGRKGMGLLEKRGYEGAIELLYEQFPELRK